MSSSVPHSHPDRELERIAAGRHHDPFAWLGRHPVGEEVVVRAFVPGVSALQLETRDGWQNMDRLGRGDAFSWRGPGAAVAERYRLRALGDGGARTAYDPYCFPPQIGDLDLHWLGEGRHHHVYRVLGAHCCRVDGVDGVRFATWAPNAERVSVVGDFNGWDGRRYPMRVRGGSGVWELFVPGLEPGCVYKFELRQRDTGAILLKADPYAAGYELRPANASRVLAASDYAWGDGAWLEQRGTRDWLHAPMSIYEVHLGSWQRHADGRFLGYRELADRLLPYVLDLGFTHIELLPVTEHPLDASWGYQSTGYFAPSSRFGDPDDFRYFVDRFHQSGVGVLLDWVPGHFPRDAHALARFDGSALYEHADPRRGEHRDWGTLIFNYGRNEVRNFLLASAVNWIEEFHIDGLRVDAVASMLYLDYSRDPHDWLPNVHGGRENLEAISFLRELNVLIHESYPGTLVIAEESTAWPQVSRPVDHGGLGFSMKWNMGWMNDTLFYFGQDPVHRKHHHNKLTFGLLYAFTENFVLPFSHDEVVHGKRAMLDKMPGDRWQKFANLRLLYAYMYTQPGRKLLFMGAELGQWHEWSPDGPLDWALLDQAEHRGLQHLVRDLNRLHRDHPALHAQDFESSGFTWLDADNRDDSLLLYLRHGAGETLLVALNFTPVPREGRRVGVPMAGSWREVFNSDSGWYGGGDVHNGDGCRAEPIGCMGQPHSLLLRLPPLGAVVLELARG